MAGTPIKRKIATRNRVQVRMKRISGSALMIASKLPSEAIHISLVLNDLSAKGVGLFLSKKIEIGQELQISINEPKPFQARGRVVWCHEHNLNSNIVTENPLKFRAGLLFVFANDEESKKMVEIWEELAKIFPIQIIKPPLIHSSS